MRLGAYSVRVCLAALLCVQGLFAAPSTVLAEAVNGAQTGTAEPEDRAPENAPKESLTATVFGLAPYGASIQGQPVGMLPDFFHELARRSGIRIDIVISPYARMEKRLHKGETDLAIFMRSPDSETFGEPIAFVNNVSNIIMPQPGKSLPQDVDIKSLRVTVLRGGYFAEKFNRDPEQTFVPVNNYREGTLLLLHRRVDAMIGVSIAVFHNLLELSVAPTDIGKPLMFGAGEAWLHRAYQSKHGPTDARLIAAIESMLEDNYWEQIRFRYVPVENFSPEQLETMQ